MSNKAATERIGGTSLIARARLRYAATYSGVAFFGLLQVHTTQRGVKPGDILRRRKVRNAGDKKLSRDVCNYNHNHKRTREMTITISK